MSSANASNLVWFKILSSGNGLNLNTANQSSFTEEDGKMSEAGALPTAVGAGDMSESDAAIAMAMAATKNGDSNIEIDEALFDGEDLDIVEEDLETLDLED